jgi:hypothetical protein
MSDTRSCILCRQYDRIPATMHHFYDKLASGTYEECIALRSHLQAVEPSWVLCLFENSVK